MFEIIVPASELFDNKTSRYIYTKETKIQLEHSLISVSRWESKWKKPYLSEGNKTFLESIDYIRCMSLSKGVDQNVYLALTKKQIDQINDYINDSMTATTINKIKSGKKEILTSERIYYWMLTFQIPFECEKWHLNRLLTLIEVCSIENGPKEKMPLNEIYSRNKALNEARKAKHHTRG